MPYLLIEDFKNGLDVRKSTVTAPPGTLLKLTNAHLTRGGEIEKRQAFVPLADLPAGLVKGSAAAPGVLYLFGQEEWPAGVPLPTIPETTVIYQQLGPPAGITDGVLVRITSVEFWGSKPFVVAEWTSDQVKPDITPDPGGGTTTPPSPILAANLAFTLQTGVKTVGTGDYDIGPQIVTVTASRGTPTYTWKPIGPEPLDYTGAAKLYLVETGNPNERTIRVVNQLTAGTYTTRVYVDVTDTDGASVRLHFDIAAVWYPEGGTGGGGGGGDPWPPLDERKVE